MERSLHAIHVYVALKAFILIGLALNTRFVMDEFWHFSQPVYLFDGIFDSIWPAKAVGYALFFEIPHAVGWDAVSTLMAGRLSTAFLALALVWVIYMLVRAQGHDQLTALLAIALLLSISSFAERSFRLRSEPLAVLFSATALLYVVRYGADRARTVLLAGLLCGFAFVTTQKAVYFNFALGVGMVVDALAARQITASLRRGALLVVGWFAAIALYAVGLGGTAAQEVLRLLFLGPMELALEGGGYYEGLSYFIWQTLERNAVSYGLIVVGLCYATVTVAREHGAARIGLIHALVAATLVYTHNQPWPYTFATALPFLAMYGALALRWLAGQRGGTVLVAVLVLVITAQSFVRNVQYFRHDNHAQFALIQTAEGMLGPDETYFDGIGMIPSRRMEPRIWLDAERVRRVLAEGEKTPLVRALRAQEPTLVIESYRTDALSPLISETLETGYLYGPTNIRLPRRLKAGNEVAPERVPLFSGVYVF